MTNDPVKFGALVIDVSGSMDAPANVGAEQTGRSVLKVTTQAASAFLAGLPTSYAICIIAFNGFAHLKVPMTQLSDNAAVQGMHRCLENLEAEGQTNTCA